MRGVQALPRTLPRAAMPLRTPLSSGRRYASSGQSAPRRFLSTTLVVGGTVALVAFYYDSRSALHEHVVMPAVRLFDPETGHRLAVKLLSLPRWARPHDQGTDSPLLKTELFGLPLDNPVGVAAGFDKDAEAIDGLFDLGFGYVEVGSVTPEPQPGNPQPRFFRLLEDDACINRYGFNSLGHGHALLRLRARVHALAKSDPTLFPSPLPLNPLPPASLPRSLRPGHILAVNLGKNKTSAADSNEDYVRGVRTLGPYADVVVINVSSPNTPGLRALQGREILQKLLGDVVAEREKIKSPEGLPKIAVKVASDLSEDELRDVAVAARNSGVEGVIVSNTTIRRKELDLISENQDQVGGLSGKPLFPYALGALRTLRPLLPASIPIIGCGGIWTGENAIDMAKAGASLVQVYTSFGYRGVGTARALKDEITDDLKGQKWSDVVGLKHAGRFDEGILQRESETLKREAEGLGQLLRHINEKEDLRKLVEEAEAAIHKPIGSITSSSSAGAITAPRDNALGSGDSTSLLGAPPSAEEDDFVKGIERAIIAAIEGKPQSTVQVPDPSLKSTPEPQDEFTQKVRSGNKRLV